MTINEDFFDFLEVAQNSDKKQKGNDNDGLSLFCSGHCKGHQAKRPTSSFWTLKRWSTRMSKRKEDKDGWLDFIYLFFFFSF